MKASDWSFVKCLSLSAVLGLVLILPESSAKTIHSDSQRVSAPGEGTHCDWSSSDLSKAVTGLNWSRGWSLLLRSSLMVTLKAEAACDPDTFSSSLGSLTNHVILQTILDRTIVDCEQKCLKLVNSEII